MNDLSRPDGWDAATATPPGTPPPPYPSPLAGRKQGFSNRSSANTDDGDVPYEEVSRFLIHSIIYNGFLSLFFVCLLGFFAALLCS